MARHLTTVHKQENEVQKLMALPLRSNERREILERLRRQGNFLHNEESVKNNKGNIVPQMRPSNCEINEINPFLACVHCKGYFRNSYMYRHHQRCLLNKNNVKEKNGKK